MASKLIALLVLLPLVALGQAGNFNGSITSGTSSGNFSSLTVNGVVFSTTAPLNLFVATTGSDTNNCTSAATPCLTIAAAVAKIPKFIFHPVVLTIGAGSFTGAIIDVYNISTNGSITITGTMETVTPTTGSATGTFSAGAAGSNITTSWGTATDATGTWTANDFRDTVPAWIVTTGGTGSGQTRKIATNTGTVLTITGGWATTPNGTTTYALQQPGTIINANASFTPFDATAAVTAGIIINTVNGSQPDINNPAGFQRGGKIVIQNIKFTNASRAIRQIGPGTLSIKHVWCAVNNSCFNLSSNGLMVVEDSFAAPTASGNFIQRGGTDPPNFITTGNLMHSSTFAYQMEVGSWLSNADYFFGQTSAVLLQLSGGNQIARFLGTIVDCNSAGGDGVRGNVSFFGAAFTSLTTSSISNCATAVLATGGTFTALTLAGTGNTTAISAVTGGKMNIRSDVTLTGATEISVDGVSYTLAALRALAPKVVSTANWGTVVGEL